MFMSTTTWDKVHTIRVRFERLKARDDWSTVKISDLDALIADAAKLPHTEGQAKLEDEMLEFRLALTSYWLKDELDLPAGS